MFCMSFGGHFVCSPEGFCAVLAAENIEAWLSLVERYIRDVEVASSNLVASMLRNAGNPAFLFFLQHLINQFFSPLVDTLLTLFLFCFFQHIFF